MCGAAPAAGCAWTACPPQVENTRRKPTTKRERMASAAIDDGPRDDRGDGPGLGWRMRRKCEVGAVPDAAAKLLSLQQFRAAASARGAPHRCAPGRSPWGATGRARKHVVRDV